MNNEVSGGAWCSNCKKCITPPRKRKNYTPAWYTICEECEPDVLDVYFHPREDSIKTTFKVKYQDIPLLIKQLELTKIKCQKPQIRVIL